MQYVLETVHIKDFGTKSGTAKTIADAAKVLAILQAIGQMLQPIKLLTDETEAAI